MLCDDILTEALEGKYETRSVFARLAKDIQSAQRFVLSRDACAAVEHLCNMKPSSTLKALQFARPPFKHTWIEMAWQDRIWAWDEVVGIEKQAYEDAPPPVRFGALWRVLDEKHQRFSITIAWRHRNPLLIDTLGLQIGGADAVIDVDEGFPEMPRRDQDDMIRALKTDYAMKRAALHVANPIEIQAMLQLDKHAKIEPCSYWWPLYEMMMRRGQDISELMELARRDIEGETAWAIAAAIMLNTKNLAEAEPIDITRLNKARVKSGKRPMLEHKVLNLKLTKVMHNRGEATGMTREQMRLHMVRGHVKVRKTGAFWWSPHPRGVGALGVITKTYKV